MTRVELAVPLAAITAAVDQLPPDKREVLPARIGAALILRGHFFDDGGIEEVIRWARQRLVQGGDTDG